jgi:hypothetical protein
MRLYQEQIDVLKKSLIYIDEKSLIEQTTEEVR